MATNIIFSRVSPVKILIVAFLVNMSAFQVISKKKISDNDESHSQRELSRLNNIHPFRSNDVRLLHPMKSVKKHNRGRPKSHVVSKRSLDILTSAHALTGMNQNFLRPMSTRAGGASVKDILSTRLNDVLRELKAAIENNRSKKSNDALPDPAEGPDNVLSLDRVQNELKFQDIKDLASATNDHDKGQYSDSEGDKENTRVNTHGLEEWLDHPLTESELMHANDDLIVGGEQDKPSKRFDVLSNSPMAGMRQNFVKRQNLNILTHSSMGGMGQNFLDKRFDTLSSSDMSGFGQNHIKRLSSPSDNKEKRFVLANSPMSGMGQNHVKRFDPLAVSGLASFSQNHLKKRFNALASSSLSGFDQNYLKKRFNPLASSGMSSFDQNFVKKRFDPLAQSGLSSFNQNFFEKRSDTSHARLDDNSDKRFDSLSRSDMSSFGQNYLKKRFNPLASSGMSAFDQNYLKKRFNPLASSGMSAFDQNHLKKRFNPLASSGMSAFDQNHLKKRFNPLASSGLSAFDQNYLKKRFNPLASSSMSAFGQNHFKKRFNPLARSSMSAFDQNHLKKRFDPLARSDTSAFGQNFIKKRGSRPVNTNMAYSSDINYIPSVRQTNTAGGEFGVGDDLMAGDGDGRLSQENVLKNKDIDLALQSLSDSFNDLITPEDISLLHQNRIIKRDVQSMKNSEEDKNDDDDDGNGKNGNELASETDTKVNRKHSRQNLRNKA